jgi:sulfhydrogenase subunit beta (sulfur reductase)
MGYMVLKKSFFNDFISQLLKKSKVVAPVDKGYNRAEFAEITSGNQIKMQYIPTVLPPKKYFMPQYETLIEYNAGERQKMEAVVEYEPLIIFAVHTCDLAGIQSLNMVFSDRPKDLHYLIRKNNMTIIGFECNSYCDTYASCCLMDNHLPNGGYDLFMTDLGDYYLIHVQTQMGEEITRKMSFLQEAGPSHMEDLDKLRTKKREIFKNEVDVERDEIPVLFDKGFDHPVWDEIGSRCLSCANCTNVCPTCYCFDVMDMPNMDLKTGRRIRVWDSCQNEHFAKVSSGESFRATRSDRKRHRFYRKFKYHNERFSRFFCTGCGRCSRTCMAKINLKETISALKKESL